MHVDKKEAAVAVSRIRQEHLNLRVLTLNKPQLRSPELTLRVCTETEPGLF